MERPDSQALARGLERLSAAHLRRVRHVIDARPQPGDPTRVMVEGRLLRNFCSNDYLGLSTHPDLIAAAQECLQRDGLGAGASHLVTGHGREHHALEEELAAFTGRERALLFSSGYLANLGVTGALAGRTDRIVADRLCHASLLDGALLSGARLRRYAHCDYAAALRLLRADAPPRGVQRREHPSPAASSVPSPTSASAALLLTDGVFSMDGDVAPLAQLAALATREHALLIVDDAHGLGVLGAGGRGTLESSGVPNAAVPVLIGTLGKAFGSFGAFVAGDAALIEHLLQHARSYIYTTALPPAVAAASRAALRLIEREPWRRERVLALTQRWRAAAMAEDLPLADSQTPIQPLIVGEAAEALALSDALMSEGFWVSAIRPPTVPAGSARLRISLCATHQEADVDALAESLGRHWRRRQCA
jgi:8-amino-7-oxononanoate synthase